MAVSLPRPAWKVNPEIFNQRRSFEQPFQGCPLFVCEPIVFWLERLAEDFPKFPHLIDTGLYGLSDFLYQLISERDIRRILHIVLMGFKYIVEDCVPCFVVTWQKNLLPLSDGLLEF